MRDKKKKNIKVRDLKPRKDAKGGHAAMGPPPGSGPSPGSRPPPGPRPNPTEIRANQVKEPHPGFDPPVRFCSFRTHQTKRAAVPPLFAGPSA